MDSSQTDPLIRAPQHASRTSFDSTFASSNNRLERLFASPPVTAVKHKKNLVILGIAFLFNFTAFNALQNLESSLHADLGLASLSVIYGGLIVSSVVAPVLIRGVGTKWSIAICTGGYIVYTVSNYYPTLYTLIPAGLILGLAAGPLWIAQGTYLTTLAISYADIKNEVPENVINRFNGIFFFFFQGSQITGNLVASLVLFPNSSAPIETNFTKCGIQACGGHGSTDNSTGVVNNLDIPERTTTILLSVYLSCGLLSFFLVCMFLSKLHGSSAGTMESTKRNMLATLRLTTNPYILMLVPLMIYTGVEQAFIYGDFTKDFITCTDGIHYVGFVMITFGITNALCSFLLGRLEKYSGRITIFTAGGLAHLSIILVLLLVWKPVGHGQELWNRYLMAAVWGFGDAVWQTQMASILGVIFPETQEAAFSNFRLFQALGFCVYFGISTSAAVCVFHKLISLGALLLFGLFMYYIVECKIRQEILY